MAEISRPQRPSDAPRPLLAALLAAGLLLAAASAAAQEAPSDRPPAAPADVSSVDAILAAVYDVISGPAGQPRDWDRFRSLFAPGARLVPIGRRAEAGPWQAIHWTVEEYVERAGANLEESGFFEREIHRVSERFGPLIHVWSTYEARRSADDPEPFARGINSFQLLDDGSRIWVVTVFWSAEGPGRPIPDRYLPGGQ